MNTGSLKHCLTATASRRAVKYPDCLTSASVQSLCKLDCRTDNAARLRDPNFEVSFVLLIVTS